MSSVYLWGCDVKKLNDWKTLNLSDIKKNKKNNIIIFQPPESAFNPELQHHLSSPRQLGVTRRQNVSVCVCVCMWAHMNAWWHRALQKLLFPVAIGGVFHKTGPWFVNACLLKVHELKAGRRCDGAVPTTARLFFALTAKGAQSRQSISVELEVGLSQMKWNLTTLTSTHSDE